MRNRFINICHNPRFSIWPWGNSGFQGVISTTNYGKSAARWFVQTSNTTPSDVVTISKNTNADTTKYDNWLQNAPNMTINVASVATNSTMRVRQFCEAGSAFGQSIVAMTVIASGPNGSSFYYGVGDNYAKLTTLGDDASGDPILVTETEFFAFDDPSKEYLSVTPFETPSSNGVYRLHYVQAEVLMDPTKVSDFEIRPDWFEWDIMARYITPIRQGMLGTGRSANTIAIPVVAPPGGWKKAPSIPDEGKSLSSNVVLNSATSTIISIPTPSYAVSSIPLSNNLGCVVLLGNASSFTQGSQYVIGPETTPICYLNSDYF